jgi:hypothetical protein
MPLVPGLAVQNLWRSRQETKIHSLISAWAYLNLHGSPGTLLPLGVRGGDHDRHLLGTLKVASSF